MTQPEIVKPVTDAYLHNSKDQHNKPALCVEGCMFQNEIDVDVYVKRFMELFDFIIGTAR